MHSKRYRFSRQRHFNAFVIKGRQVVTTVCTIAFIGVAVFCMPFPTLRAGVLFDALQRVLPQGQPATTHRRQVITEILSDIYPQRVLAEAIPFLYLAPPEADEEYIPPETESAPPQADALTDTFPIQNAQVISKNLSLRNETTYEPDISTLLASPLSFKSPEILIVHTHASESYSQDGATDYSKGDSDRSLDTSLNMVRVGEVLANELTARGFKVTHARDINDHPSYNQSYNRTLGVIESHITANPNIAIVLDVHRDAAIKSDGTKLKFTSVQNGETVAQLMIVCGTNQRGLPNDSWQENLKFALQMQNYMETTYPGLARPLNLRQERFNGHTTKGSVIIEVGSSGNTLAEATGSAKYLADTLSAVLAPYK